MTGVLLGFEINMHNGRRRMHAVCLLQATFMPSMYEVCLDLYAGVWPKFGEGRCLILGGGGWALTRYFTAFLLDQVFCLHAADILLAYDAIM